MSLQTLEKRKEAGKKKAWGGGSQKEGGLNKEKKLIGNPCGEKDMTDPLLAIKRRSDKNR